MRGMYCYAHAYPIGPFAEVEKILVDQESQKVFVAIKISPHGIVAVGRLTAPLGFADRL